MDHVYRHEPAAMRVMVLLTMLAMNILNAFQRLALKPALRKRFSLRHVARCVLAELFADRGFESLIAHGAQLRVPEGKAAGRRFLRADPGHSSYRIPAAIEDSPLPVGRGYAEVGVGKAGGGFEGRRRRPSKKARRM